MGVVQPQPHTTSSRNTRLWARAASWWNDPGASIERGFDPKSNSIGLLRFVLASLVIVYHSYPLGGYGADWLQWQSHSQTNMGAMAVLGFFSLSGFLIAASYVHLKSPLRFVWHRALRILPAFWACLLVTVAGFAPALYLAQHHTLAGYWTTAPGGPFYYLRANWRLAIRQYDIQQVTSGLPYANVLNGSLWTLLYEFRCYLVVGLFGFLGILTRRRLLLAVVGAWYAYYVLTLLDPGIVNGLPALAGIVLMPNLTASFLVGACFYAYRDRIVLSNRLFALACLILLVTLRIGSFAVVMPIFWAYALMYTAAFGPLRTFGAKRDLSYGVYIYAFPVQQSLAYFHLHEYGVGAYALLAFLCTLPLAAASWHFVERPSLKLKDARVRPDRPSVRQTASRFAILVARSR